MFVKGQASPYWRNQTLAYFFNKLQLAQAEGQGIPTILRTMKEEGCPDPQFEIGEENLVYVLSSHPRHAMMSTLRRIENSIVLQNYPEAITELEGVLEADLQNFRALELYCEACNMAATPERVFSFLQEHKLDYDQVNPSSKILLAETLLEAHDTEATQLANTLLKQAANANLERTEVRRIALGIRKMGNDEKAIDFIDNMMVRRPSFQEDSSFLNIRASAKIDLAKKCMETARAKYPGEGKISLRRIKARAWEQCRTYLESAEKDLDAALEYVTHPTDRDYILRARDFLETMKAMARKPRQSHARKAPGNAQRRPRRKGVDGSR